MLCDLSTVLYSVLIVAIKSIYNYKKQKLASVIVKAAVLKQQISKFYPQIQRTEASDHI